MTVELRMETVRMTQFFLLRVTVETPVIWLLWWSPQAEPSTRASTVGSGRLLTVSKALSDPDSEDTVSLHSCRSHSGRCVETRIISASLLAAPESEPQTWHLLLFNRAQQWALYCHLKTKEWNCSNVAVQQNAAKLSLKLMSHFVKLT